MICETSRVATAPLTSTSVTQPSMACSGLSRSLPIGPDRGPRGDVPPEQYGAFERIRRSRPTTLEVSHAQAPQPPVAANDGRPRSSIWLFGPIAIARAGTTGCSPIVWPSESTTIRSCPL